MTIKIPKDHIVLLTPRERVRQAAEMGAVWGGVVVGFALLASVTPWAVAAGLIAAGARTVWIVRKAVVSERQLARVFAGQRSNDIAKRNRKLVARLIGRQARVPVIITWGARSEAPEGNLSVAGRLSSSPFGKRSFIEIHQEAATDKANIGHEVAHVLRGDLARGELWRAGEISALGIVAGGVVASAFSSLSLPVMLGLVASAGLATSPLRGFWIKRKLHSLFSQQVSAPFIEHEANRVGAELVESVCGPDANSLTHSYGGIGALARHCYSIGLPIPSRVSYLFESPGFRSDKVEPFAAEGLAGLYNRLCTRLVCPVTTISRPLGSVLNY